MRERQINVPVMGSVFILRKGAARVMNRGEIPGAYVSDNLLSVISGESEADDKGRAASLERAAMQVAVIKGLGFKGVHIEAMILKFDMVETILGRARELEPQWEECMEKLHYCPEGSFYLGNSVCTARSFASAKLKKSWGNYLTMRVLHKLLFVKDGGLSGLMRTISRNLDRFKLLGTVSHFFEWVTKLVCFNCRDCGDCALPELKISLSSVTMPQTAAQRPLRRFQARCMRSLSRKALCMESCICKGEDVR